MNGATQRYKLYRGQTLLGEFDGAELNDQKLRASGVGKLRVADPSLEIDAVLQYWISPYPPLVPEVITQEFGARTSSSPSEVARQESRGGVHASVTAALPAPSPENGPPPTIPAERRLHIGMPDGSILNPMWLQIEKNGRDHMVLFFQPDLSEMEAAAAKAAKEQSS